MSFSQKIIDAMPIEKEEWKKFSVTALMLALTIYVYSILRGAKDALVVAELGAELISTLKLYGVTASAIGIMLLYIKMADFLTRTRLYYFFLAMFTGFFMVFAFVLYPNAAMLKLDLTQWKEKLPYLRYLIIMVENWSYSIFYIMSELWGSMMLSLMFWQLANQITSIAQAKRFYPLFGMVGQGGLILAGYFLVSFSSNSHGGWGYSLKLIAISVVISGGLIAACLWYLSHHLVDISVVNGIAQGKKKAKLGMKESLKHIFSSPYLGLITLLILAYGISINLVEGIWKKTLGTLFPDPTQYGQFTGQTQMWTGVATVVAMIFGSYLLQKISWKKAALLTPIMIGVTGLIFFLFMIYQTKLEPFTAFVGVSSLMLAAYAGATQNILSKATKYSFFDPTKEMAYIPLDEELKSKGKAGAEVIGGRFGKSGGALIQWALLSFVTGSTLQSLAPILFVVFIVVMIGWFFSVTKLSKQFEEKKEVM